MHWSYDSYGAVEDVPIEEARGQFEVNVFGLARLVQLVTPHMRAQKSGRIINISSIGGKFYEPFGAWYHATKFAVEGFSDSLRMELRPFGIKVVLIEPGPILTEWNEIARDSSSSARATARMPPTPARPTPCSPASTSRAGPRRRRRWRTRSSRLRWPSDRLLATRSARVRG